MTKITEDEFRDFLKRTVSDLTPPDNFMGSEKLFGKVLRDVDLINPLTGFMMRALLALGPEQAACSLWATGFQMGREFESGRAEVAELNRLMQPDKRTSDLNPAPVPIQTKKETEAMNPLRGGSPEGHNQAVRQDRSGSPPQGDRTNFFSTCRAGNFGTSPAQCRAWTRDYWRAQTLIFLACIASSAQTLVNTSQVHWQQVNLSACGIPVLPPGTNTLLDVGQIRYSPQAPLSINCWPVVLQTNAWSILTTKCTRCHGTDGPWLDSSGVWHPFPADSLLGFANTRGEVGNLDLRTFQSMRTGGNRGPAVVPGNSAASLIYRFTSLLISVPPTEADVAALDALDVDFPPAAVLMPPYPYSLSPAESAALKAWIDAGCPMQ